MKTPSRTFIIIAPVLSAIVSVVIFQACATQSGGAGNGNKFFLNIGKDENTFVEFKDNPKEGKDRFDAVLRRLPSEQYSIRYKEHDDSQVVDPYHPPSISLKTDKVTTSEIAKNEPPGDPHITQKVATDKLQDVKDIIDSLESP